MPATKAQREAAARARAGRARARLGLEGGTPTDPATQSTPQAEDDGEVCCWDGGVNAWSDDDSDDAEWIDEEDLRVEGEPEESDSDEVESLVDDELRVSLEKEAAQELEALSKATPYEAIQKRPITAKEWSAAESRVGVKNGLSARTERRNAKGLRDKEIQDAKLRKTAEAAFFRGYFAKGRVERASSAPSGSTTGGEGASTSALEDDRGIIDDDALFDGYLSDLTDSSGAEEDAEGADDWYDEDVYNAPDVTDDRPSSSPASINNSPIRDASPARSASPDEDHHPDDAEDAFAVRPPPPLKRRRLEVPARQARAHKAAEVLKKRHAALRDIKRQLSSKQPMQGGHNGLLSYRMRAIQACLHLMVKDKMRMIAASKTAAKAHLLSQGWGSRQVRRWVREYVNNRALPESKRGLHAKAFSIFGDPIVRAGVRAYMRSNKWSMNPAKLRQLMQNELERDEAVAYAKEIVSQEMPRGLKHYVEKELLPRMHQKTRGKGFSLSAMRRLMLREGFVCTPHSKGIYFDHHERPDVVDDRTNRFIPAMQAIRPRLVRYTVGDVTKRVETTSPGQDSDAEPRLVLVAHDEMTAQSNDDTRVYWHPVGEHRLKKKGVGRGLHQSDFICSTVGWLKDASQTLEYGKNYEGYWNGELFVKQLQERFFKAFEEAHGPGYTAVVLVDNSQGHSAYAADALRVTRMNLRPGGKQARMRNGWFMRNGRKVMQPMVFPSNHPTYPNQAKGMREVLVERGLWRSGLLMECKGQCDLDATACCARRILERQPDFLEQRSLVQEVIEARGHICIFLPKFHCEINFIEYFWGAVKRWLREHCDYTFETLKANMPKALASVSVELIRKWEHRAWRFIDAYGSGLDAKEAQKQVKAFSSRKYKSHRRVNETLGRALDTQ